MRVRSEGRNRAPLVADDRFIMPYFIGDSSGLCHYGIFRFPIGLLAILLAIVFGLIRRIKCRIYLARVAVGAGARPSARVLPKLPPAIPMKAKLRKLGGYVAGLLLSKLNPNPLADNLTQLPEAWGLMVKYVQHPSRGKTAIVKSLPEINPMQFVPKALCGPVLELRI